MGTLHHRIQGMVLLQYWGYRRFQDDGFLGWGAMPSVPALLRRQLPKETEGPMARSIAMEYATDSPKLLFAFDCVLLSFVDSVLMPWKLSFSKVLLELSGCYQQMGLQVQRYVGTPSACASDLGAESEAPAQETLTSVEKWQSRRNAFRTAP